MIIDKNLSPACQDFNMRKWREERLWNEPADNIFKAFQQLFKLIYEKYGGSHVKPGQKHFITVDEFETFILDIQLVNDLMGTRDISVCFNLAMLT